MSILSQYICLHKHKWHSLHMRVFCVRLIMTKFNRINPTIISDFQRFMYFAWLFMERCDITKMNTVTVLYYIICHFPRTPVLISLSFTSICLIWSCLFMHFQMSNVAARDICRICDQFTSILILPVRTRDYLRQTASIPYKQVLHFVFIFIFDFYIFKISRDMLWIWFV